MIKYPYKINEENSNIIYSNRGMCFEEQINVTNKYYLNNKIAFIYKKPTPIKVVKCKKTNNTYKIEEAYFLQPSTTDYNGLYKGKYIDFEAKQTNSRTSFPFSNILKNQIEHIINIVNNGGICFLLICFNKLDLVFLVDGKTLERELRLGKHSFSLEMLKKEGHIVPSSYLKLIDYLQVVDELYFEQ